MALAERIPTGQPGPSERSLAQVAGRVRPVVLAGERRIPVPGPLGQLLPGAGLQRGTVVELDGAPGAGRASLLLALVAAVSEAGEWAAVVDTDGTFGALAAAEAGVVLDRLAVVRAGVLDRPGWARVVATLLDGVTLVAAGVPPFVRLPEARRLAARARERAALLVVAGRWPGEAALRLRAEGSTWDGLGRGDGLLAGRRLRVALSGRGAAGRGGGGEITFGPARVPASSGPVPLVDAGAVALRGDSPELAPGARAAS